MLLLGMQIVGLVIIVVVLVVVVVELSACGIVVLVNKYLLL